VGTHSILTFISVTSSILFHELFRPIMLKLAETLTGTFSFYTKDHVEELE